MTKTLIFATALAATTALPVLADPALGFGVSLAFGGGNVETGVGLRAFSDDEEDSFVASVGVDYMFQSQRVRPTVGAAYLGDDTYFGVDMGFGLNGEGVDFGVGVGGLDTQGAETSTSSTSMTVIDAGDDYLSDS
ncbi:hypothetical protein Q4555_00410 [Octadecabacter sp. 1_MG-2023]|uniref:hypothetical protein n=1 Tax=unclassified Octadecabacter TaxID=196158 RepID=UPI001C093470|nr:MULTISPECIES: hypothetical protein [unclassified Octadecabacter]MBU2993434.1 hypothetical protein [Octadecabacter sp. B2R22]MDO6733110.1 hypothetical protein [Octadecabacter sp. 1_MG-2023]